MNPLYRGPLQRMHDQLAKQSVAPPPEAQGMVTTRLFAPVAQPPAYTDEALALEFAERHAGDLRYVAAWGKWLIWTGTHWRIDDTLQAVDHARQICRDAAASCKKGRTAAMLASAKTIAAVERLAKADRRIAATVDEWDTNPWLLGTPGGTIDLRTGYLRQADPTESISKITAVSPASSPDCPRFITFLNEATGGDAALMLFLQQYCGYCLTGVTREHALAFLSGGGKNGKTTFVNAITRPMGDYASTAAMDTFIAAHGDRHPTDLASLRGARLVAASETEEGRRWAEARIKQLTGGDAITARYMRQDFFTFVPTFKLLIVGNHRPVLRNVDDAARRRFNIVPFDRKPANPDAQLEDKLRDEWPSILRWMIEGCLDWQRNGLLRAASVVETTNSYFSDQDLFGQWLDEKCDLEPSNLHKFGTSADLYASWSAYATAAGDRPGGQRSFSEALQRRGVVMHRTKHARTYRGVALRLMQGKGDG
ncbi:MAG: phage/plasmid primase, P4 family [Hyphomicrobiales bacterium]